MSSFRPKTRLRLVFAAMVTVPLVLCCCDGAQRRGPEGPSSTSSEETTSAVTQDLSPPPVQVITETFGQARTRVSDAETGAVEWIGTVYPDIFSVMVAAGFVAADSGDLADYLPLPPAARGQVGQFSRAGETIFVARVSYLSEEFAAPHATLVEERLALLTEANERLVHLGPTVIHIKAETAAVADQVERLFAPDESTQRIAQ